jgi:putative serine protease PepD
MTDTHTPTGERQDHDGFSMWTPTRTVPPLPAPPPGDPVRAGTPEPVPPAPADGGRGGRGRGILAAALVAAVVATGVSVPVTLAVTERGQTVVAADPETTDRETTDREATGRETTGSGSTTGADTTRGSTVAEVADAVLPSVARVDITGRGTGSGSAVVYRADGYLLTNAHVVAGAADIRVTLPDGTVATAELVGADTASDLAVIRIDLRQVAGVSELPVPAFADALPRIGETAVAIGSPFGLDGSVTAGVVSAVGRSIPGALLVDAIQTDAPINPGNSGGALVNDRAEVIGINTAILSPSRENNGIGFAIPITNALPIAEQLVEQGFVAHGQLGITGQDVDARVAELYGLPVTEGAVIAEVLPGSGADAAGLRRGDIIIAVDGQRVSSMVELGARVRRHAPGDTLSVTYLRGAEEAEVRVTLSAARSD